MKKALAIGLIFFAAAGCSITSSGSLGVIKTLDGGGSWQTANNIDGKTAINNLVVSEIQFDPSNHGNLYLAAQNSGMWVSTDSAASWKQILSRITLYDFYLNPGNTNNILTVGIFSDHGKIVRTNDGGASWEEVYNEASAKNAVNTITGNPNNSSELYAGLNSGVLIKSQDGGVNWFVVYDFKDQIIKARYNRLNSSLYVLTRNKGLWKSTNGGVNWASITTQLAGTGITQMLDTSSVVPAGVSSFVKLGLDDTTAGVIYLTTSDGLYKSTNDGQSWSFIFLPVKRSALQPRAIASSRGGVIAYTSIGNTIYKTLDGGQSWQTQQLPTPYLVNTIIIDPVMSQISYAGLIK